MVGDLFFASEPELPEVGLLRVSLLDALFDRMPIGLAIIDRSLKLCRVNTTWKDFLQRYAPLSNPQIEPTTTLFDLFPDERERFTPSLEDAFDGKVIRADALALERDGVVSYWDVVLTPQRRAGVVWALLIVAVDASDRVFANRLLEEKEAQYRGIFEATSDGVLILDAKGKIVEANPAVCVMHGYTYAEMIGRESPELFSPTQFTQALDRIFKGASVDVQSVNYRKNGESFDVEIRANLFTFRGEPHMLAVVRDITERAQAFQMLEQRVEERTRELSTLLQASSEINSTLDLEPLLNKILNELQAVIDYNGAAIYTLQDEDTLDLLIYRGPIPQDELQRSRSLTRDHVFGEVIRRQAPVIVADVRADTLLAQTYRESAGEQVRYVGSWMGIPLIVRQRVIGMLGFDSRRPGYFTTHLANLALAFGNQAAVAMDNSRLYLAEQERRYETEQRRRVAESLRDILNIINSNRSLEAILDYIVLQASRLLGTGSIAIFALQQGVLMIQTSIGLDERLVRGFKVIVGRGAIGRAVAERHPVICDDLEALALLQEGEFRHVIEVWAQQFRALLAVPMIARDEVYGGMVLYYPDAHQFSDEEVQLVVAVCDQAALAIENARLRAQATQAAVAAERSRLARDLHDAVTQTLFSASLIAEVLPRLWERDRDEGLHRLTDLRQLTRGALAEMRTLLLELRPATLVEAELRDLIHQLCDALAGRARIPVNLQVEGAPRLLPPDVQIAFYRVAQEALNNIFKHSEATRVDLALLYEPDGLLLTVCDNGHGFDPARIANAESFGLNIMRERAEGIGAEFGITSDVRGGTCVSLRWVEEKSDERSG